MARRLLWLLPASFFGVFYVYPLAAILGASGGQEILSALTDARAWRVAGFTFWQAFVSTAVTLLVGMPGAYLVGRFRFRGSAWLRALTAVPFVMPTLVVAAGFNALIGERGWINIALMKANLPPLDLSGSLTAIVLAHVFYNTTIVIRLVGDYWSHLDPRLSQAAHTLGTSKWQTFARVTLPLLAPAVASAALLVFIFNFTSFGVVLILGGPRLATLEVEIYRQAFAFFDLPASAALSLIQMAFTVLFALIYTRLTAKRNAFVNLRGADFAQRRLSGWRLKAQAAVIVTMLAVLLLSPLAALAARSVLRLEADRGSRQEVRPSFTIGYYTALFQNEQGSAFFATPIESVGNSARVAAATVALSLLLGIPTAYWLANSGASPGRRLIEAGLMLPLGTSAVTLGLGFLLAFSTPPFNLRASPVLLPLAHTLIAFPFVVRSLLPTWQSIRPQWRQAAATLGASPWQVWRRVELPLLGRAALVAAAFAFSLSFGEFGATALLSRPEFPTIATAIYSFIGKPGALNFGRALALSTLLMCTTGIGVFAIERVRLKGLTEF